MKVLVFLVAIPVMLFAANVAYGLGGGGSQGDGRMVFLQNPGTSNGGSSNSVTQNVQTGSDGSTGGSVASLSSVGVQNSVTVPEPVTLFSLGLGILGLAGIRRRFKR